MAEIELINAEKTGPAEPLSESPMKVVASQSGMERIEEHDAWPLLSRMTVSIAAGVPLNQFKVGDLLRLEPGTIVESEWPYTEDIPVKAGHIQVAWSEFEVVDQRLLIRLTRLA